MNSDDPIISVLMTAYNRENYIAEAIQSVLDSDFIHFELIIVDDRSTDTTFEIAKQFEQKDSRVKVYLNEKNLGDYPNRNAAAGYARGKYLKYLDSDDTIYPWGLTAMIYCMEKEPTAAVGLMSRGEDDLSPLPVLKSGTEAYRLYFFNNKFLHMGPSGSIIRTDVFRKLGGFSGKNYIGDTELWLNIADAYPLVCMPHDLIWWRQHEGQQIKEEKLNPDFESDKMQLYRKSLLSKACALPLAERKMALRNQLNIRARQFYQLIFSGQLHKAFKLFRYWKLTGKDLLLSFKKNQYPSG